jgi:hypothetical protein
MRMLKQSALDGDCNWIGVDECARTLAVHTSCGVSPALPTFIEALRPHLPWPTSRTLATPAGGAIGDDVKASDEDHMDDWFVNLQLEGASAVHAAVDALLQLQQLKLLDGGFSPRHQKPRRTKVRASEPDQTESQAVPVSVMQQFGCVVTHASEPHMCSTLVGRPVEHAFVTAGSGADSRVEVDFERRAQVLCFGGS